MPLSPFIFSDEACFGVRIQSARFLDVLEDSVEERMHEGVRMTPFAQDENGWPEFVAGEFFLEKERPKGG